MPTPSNPSRVADGVGYAFALLPDAGVREQFAVVGERLQRVHRVGGTRISADALRLDLCPMGRVVRLVRPAEQALLAAGAAVSTAGFTLTFDSATRLHTHAVQFPLTLKANAASTAAALELRKALAAAQAAVGLQVLAVTGFSAYIALMQGDTLRGVEEIINPIEWTVREFVLIRRFFGGLRHEVIGRWPLTAPADDGPIDLMAELARMTDDSPPAMDE
ncbi:MAG: 2'-5' RNA ligase [Rhodanobacter sp.]|nr:MAG: 2'-5' RNA ligase [Rhodanobacter sp.]TAM13635.1 MAG: 2'-5' RNA ligase [Rhodanobacter sp.]TAM35611.1 MAG: 2'-5' RNA ligase [Rhodanobacter sp.]